MTIHVVDGKNLIRHRFRGVHKFFYAPTRFGYACLHGALEELDGGGERVPFEVKLNPTEEYELVVYHGEPA